MNQPAITPPDLSAYYPLHGPFTIIQFMTLVAIASGFATWLLCQ